MPGSQNHDQTSRRNRSTSNPLIVVAHTHRIGRYYADQFGEPHARVVTDRIGLHGWGPGVQIVVVNSDDGGHFADGVVDRLRVLEAQGVDIDWLG